MSDEISGARGPSTTRGPLTDGRGERASGTTRRAPWPVRLLARWPAALGVGLVLLMGPHGDPALVPVLAELLVVLALIYLCTAVLGRPDRTWVVLAALFALFAAARMQPWVPPVALLLGLGAAVTAAAAAAGRLDRGVGPQVAATAGFGALAVTALLAGPGPARLLVAAGWIGHGLWDLAHHRANRTVARSFAEFCGVADLGVGLGVLVLP
ncbi:hypothetical protein ACWEVD_23060 [Nocardia thailandica]